LNFLVALYLPSLKFRKTARPKETENLEIFYMKSKALSIINPKRFFIESIFICKEVTRYNLSGFKIGLMIFIASSSLFSFTGLSFRLSRKILDSSKKLIESEQAKIVIIYDTMETFHNYVVGDWFEIGTHDPQLVKTNLSEGEIYLASQHLYWHGCPSIYKGDFYQAHTIMGELSSIAEVYENDFSILLNYLVKIKLLMETRQLNEALCEVDEAIDFGRKKGFSISLLDFYSSKARIYTFLKDIDNATTSFQQAERIHASVKAAPIQLSIYFRSQLNLLLYRLHDSIRHGNRETELELRVQAAKVSAKLIRVTRKAAQHRTEALRMKGVYYWLTNKPDLAFKWFSKSVQEGERLGARPELSRTYYQIGKRLIQTNGKYKHLNGIKPEEFLNKAKSIFEELRLEWDLDKLARLGNL
jgi:tetratricopeptide (TPR) repeat protein